MRLGLHIAYWGLGLDADDQMRLVQEAEELDFQSVWVGEAYGSDAPTILSWIAARTSRIEVCSGVFQMPARSAAMTAMTGATLDQLTQGRFRLGLGTSGPQVAEGWHGSRFDRPLTRTREYIDVLRMAWRREKVQYDGKTLQLPLPDGPGKPLKLTIHTYEDRQIPIYLAALGPQNTTLCGEIADGWLPVLFSPENVDATKGLLEKGAEKAGRSVDDIAIAPICYSAVMDDIDKARDAVRPMTALYVGGMGSREKNFYNALVQKYGFEDAAKEVQDLYLDGKKEEAMAALPDELIDTVCLVGTPDSIGDRLQAYADAGVEQLLVNPIGDTVEDRLEQLRALARAGVATA
jgi:F420-dependent oxidoreductase-like protein